MNTTPRRRATLVRETQTQPSLRDSCFSNPVPALKGWAILKTPSGRCRTEPPAQVPRPASEISKLHRASATRGGFDVRVLFVLTCCVPIFGHAGGHRPRSAEDPRRTP